MDETSIQAIQGTALRSPLEGRAVRTRGVVTGGTRRGFFVQETGGEPGGAASRGLFVFGPGRRPPLGAEVVVDGRVVDYVPDDDERPTTQVELHDYRVVREDADPPLPVPLDAALLARDERALRERLNALEGMLVMIPAGATLIAPSNPFGDYVALPPGLEAPRTHHGGVRIEPERPDRWYPSFRILDYDRAPRVNVGATLPDAVVGPLNYRSSAYQIAALGTVRVEAVEHPRETTSLRDAPGGLTVLTLNGFNLDRKIERADRVHDPRRDVDDDLGDGRFRGLARDVVGQAGAPAIVALQEIQDDDGAELSRVVDAGETYRELIDAIRRAGGPSYRWADRPPEADADGGQPGGNIRNGFLYDPGRVDLDRDALRRLGDGDPDFEDSRKPLVARFRERANGRTLVIVNVHLASKRHRHGPFAEHRPGFDPREATRVRQAERVAGLLDDLDSRGEDYYVTGDFNDHEFSDTLAALAGGGRVNLATRVDAEGRYDYNHRGLSQVLMHGVVSGRQARDAGVAYEILHGNELTGVRPGSLGAKPTDHAYVIARV